MVAFRTSSHTAESEAEISRIRHHSPPYHYRLDDGYLCALKRPSCVTRRGMASPIMEDLNPSLQKLKGTDQNKGLVMVMVIILHDCLNMSKQGEGKPHRQHVPSAQVMPTRGLGDVDLESAGFLAATCPECRSFARGACKLGCLNLFFLSEDYPV